jgi:hypothetical protein
MRIKVYDGTTTNSGSSLCGTCRHATITRGRRLDEELVQCQAIPMTITRITFKVTSCSSYNDVRQPTYLEMLEDAWILQPASKKRPAGFVRASELRERELRSILADLHSHADE